MGFGVLPQLQDFLKGYGFVVALPQEAHTLSRSPPRVGHMISLSPGRWLGVSGMGAVRARRMALLLIAEGARGLISWGTCGGLAPELSAGALIVASHVLALDGARYPTSVLPVTAYADVLTRSVHSGALLSVPDPVMTVEEKATLYQQFGALGVDMESVALARVAAERGVGFLAVRAVVDPATEPLPAALMDAVDELGHLRLGALLGALGLSASRWRDLWRLKGHFQDARSNLEAFAAVMKDDSVLSPPGKA